MIWLIVFGSIALLFLLPILFGAPYVPTHKKRLGDAFEALYPISVDDVVVDVGSGDGVVLRYVSKKGARAVGLEINLILCLISRLLSWHDKNIKIQLGNFWTVQLPDDVTVVYAFTVSRDIDRMISRLGQESSRLGRPIVFISYGIESSKLKPARSVGAHHRYDITPLQVGKP